LLHVIKSNTSHCHAMMVMPLLLMMILGGWSSCFLLPWLNEQCQQLVTTVCSSKNIL
jgi:hypothetical protein